jgi:hyperosmotically inducible protein
MSGSLFVALVFVASVGGAASGADDSRLLEAARLAVEGSPHFTIFDDVSVETDSSVITLRGRVTTPEKKDALGRAVAGLAGAHAVVNTLSVLPASDADQALRERVARAIYGHPAFWHYSLMPNPSIHILVERGRVTLMGRVRTDGERALAGALASQAGASSPVVELAIAAGRDPR